MIRSDGGATRMHHKKPDGALSDDEIAVILERHIKDALNRTDGDISGDRERMLSRYRGDPIGFEEAGRSQFCTREIFEMIEEALPGLLGVFFSSRPAVVFEPRSIEDEAAAKQETAIVDHYMFRRANMFLTIQEVFKAALLDPVAYAKVHAIVEEDTIEHAYDELTAQQFDKLMSAGREWEPGVEIQESVRDGEIVFAFSGTEVTREPKYIVEAVPPEQVLVGRDARTLDLDQAWDDHVFVCHETDETMSDLIKRGYDEDELAEIGQPRNVKITHNSEIVNRHDREDERPFSGTPTEYATRRLTVQECYVKMDCDGTGIAVGHRIVLVGGKVFEKQRTSYQPMVAFSAVPMPFKHVGISMAEYLEDLQLLKTKLVRLLLDDGYRNETRRMFVNKQSMTPNTKEQLADPLAAHVEVKGDPRASVMPEPRFTIANEMMAAIQYADDMVKRRTGMAPDNTLNPDVLRDATAHGMLASMDAQSSRLMHLARNFAESGVKRVGTKLHQLLRMHQNKRTTVRVRGEWVDVDPAGWEERADMQVTVGLGFNAKPQEIAALTQLLTLQKEALEQGLSSPAHIKNTLEKLINLSEIGFYGEFFVDPTKPGWRPPPPKPDPQMEAIKAQVQVAQGQEKTKQLGIHAEASAAAQRAETDRIKADADSWRIKADAHLKQLEARAASALLVETKYLEAKQIEADIAKTKLETARLAAEIDKISTETDTLQAEPADSSEEEETDEEG